MHGKNILLLSSLSLLVCACENNSVANVSTVSTNKTYTVQDVTLHATKEDCWLAIDGKVYDVTQFISKHPGGAAILSGCGKDATELFHSKNGKEKDHSSRADGLMDTYYIGDLKV